MSGVPLRRSRPAAAMLHVHCFLKFNPCTLQITSHTHVANQSRYCCCCCCYLFCKLLLLLRCMLQDGLQVPLL